MTSRSPRRRLLGQAAALSALPLLASLPGRALAQTFPSHAIRLVVPYPPGGSSDILARAFAEKFAEPLGQPVVIENRPGGSTNIGLEITANSPPDGYTLYFGTSGMAANPHFGPVPPVDVLKAFAPVSLVASTPFLVAANPKFEPNTPKEFLALAKAKPGKLMISSASLETTVKTLTRRANIDLVHVPYKGGAQATNDTIAGHVELVIALLPVLLPHVKAGKLKPIAISDEKRAAAAPDIPTFQEIGIEGPAPSWYALFAPAGTPQAAIRTLNAAAATAAANEQLVAQMRDQGIDIRSSSAADLGAQLERDYRMNAQLLKEIS